MTDDVPSFEEMAERVRESIAEAEPVVGWVHDVEVSELYDGVPGSALTVSILGPDGEVSSALVWIPGPGMPQLRRVLDRLNSPEFLRVFPAPLKSRTPDRRPGKRQRP
ncbi:hypothetical protein GCM10022221_79310 [Actinocorallia aurea]